MKIESWMTDDQKECAQLVADAMCGWHHIGAKFKEWGSGIRVCVSDNRMATFDFDLLTRLVLLAHDRCIRIEIANGGPRRVALILHKRHKREGGMIERHPTIDDAIAVHRKSFA